MHERIVRLFTDHYGTPPEAILEVAGDGSARSYFRLVGPELETAIGAVGPEREENRAFLSFSRAFRSIGLSVPEIYAADEEAGVWLEEDLGETTLFDALAEARGRTGERFPDEMESLYRRVLTELPRFQVEGGRAVDYDVAYPRSAFDRQSILWDLNYFKYHFLKLAHIPFNEQRLERDVNKLAKFLLRADLRHFLYRDFQSRNIMIQDGEPWFIDYQGGRRGALQYDVASLLYDAKADLPNGARARLMDHYLDVLESYQAVDRDLWREHFKGYVLVRVMQAMGAYGYRGFFERKPRFLQSVPYAAKNLERLLEEGLPLDLPEMESAFRRIVQDWSHAPGEPDGDPGLTVYVNSFSYKRGYPEDMGGHGGGYVFDCRALPNPGRHLRFRTQCGTDDPVVDYLEARPEVDQFWEHSRGLVDAQVGEYLRRGFTSLTISFGCTGGQHRSVYFAERLARHLLGHYPDVNVRVTHREEHYWPRDVDEAGGLADEAGPSADEPDPDAGRGDRVAGPRPRGRSGARGADAPARPSPRSPSRS